MIELTTQDKEILPFDGDAIRAPQVNISLMPQKRNETDGSQNTLYTTRFDLHVGLKKEAPCGFSWTGPGFSAGGGGSFNLFPLVHLECEKWVGVHHLSLCFAPAEA